MVRRFACTLFAVSLVLVSAATVTSGPNEVAAASKILKDGDDFRLRVDAALRLGNTGDSKARKPLEAALEDAHPSVRQAAATALSKLGDQLAIPALEERVKKEANAPTKAAMKKAVDELKASSGSSGGTSGSAPDWSTTKYVVKLNKVTNTSGVRGEALAAVLEGSARAKLGTIPGVLVIPDGSAGTTMLTAATSKSVPVVGVDAALVSCEQATFAGDVKVQAKVSLTITKLQVIKASIEGNASTIGSASSTKNPVSMAKLQDMAVDGAVISAMNKAPGALKAAAGK